ncbi:hypothetical protein O181_020328 [Austropuccinia psidii MF-1]|uniref:Uncharacterized protein n=1 Tax=Austropuccinia psidii MF-1 TaxID=1389203 RepID=A0A9Q3CCQ2_9BASI|nr:hypothetical protein [Austropuccinia psidii MF-1]
MAFFFTVPSLGSLPLAQRSQVFVSFVSRSNPATKPLRRPDEIAEIVGEEEWHIRTIALWKHFARYTWPKLLRVYLAIAFVVSILGPICTNVIINRIIFGDLDALRLDATNTEIKQRVVIIRRAHVANFLAIFLTMIIVWAPYFTHRTIAKKRLSALLNSFNEADAAKGNVQALVWACDRASTFQANAVISVQLPVAFVSANQPTAFHQAAYLPAYIQKTPSQFPPPIYGGQLNQNTGPTYHPPDGPPPLDHDIKAQWPAHEKA